jgi:3-deoxy-D-manno-octulosonic acid kinase
MAVTQEFQAYRIGSETELTELQKRQLAACFEKPVALSQGGVLGGRTEVLRTELEGIGPVVVKQYFRGGLVQNLLKQTYMNTGSTRCRAEYELLCALHRAGVQVPEPVAFATSGGLFYRAWLVTRAIDNGVTLAGLSEREPERAAAALKKVGQQVALLVDNRLHHVDFHPGNVLVDRENRVFLIDFDKARFSREGRESLQQRYLERWRRAVQKHGLPPFLADLAIEASSAKNLRG